MGVAVPGRISSHVVCAAGPAKPRVPTRQAIRAGLLVTAGAAVLTLVVAATARAVPRVPAGFVVETVAAGLESPTAIVTLPDGRLLVAEQPGRVRLVSNGVLSPTPVWAAENEVLFEQEAGLVGIAVDPAFATNHFLYFWYTVDPDSNGDDLDDGGAFGRLTRYTMRVDGSDTVDPASRTILLGTSFADAPITGTHTHTVGTLRWGSDGTLLLSHGDGDDWSQLDVGGLYPDVFEPGRADPDMDIGAYRSQSIASLNGKILRIDPATGHGLPSNPFWDGNPASNRSKVFAYGLRNPFRFAVRPGTGDTNPAFGNPGVLYVGDVGWFRWEELNVVTHSGLNFGWPAFEGLLPEIEYTAAQPFRLGADSIGITPDDPLLPTPPLAAWAHGVSNAGVPGGFTGGANVGGVFYTGTGYPANYRGRYFHADYGAQGGWIRAVTVTPDDRLVSFDSFGTAMDAPVDLALEPGTGDLLYVSYFTGQVRVIRWTGAHDSVTPPVAYGSGEPRLGLAPLSVQFRSAGSFDPDGGAITTHWDFGDGTSSDGVLDPVHVYTTPGAYLAAVTVTDPEFATDRDTMTIVVVPAPVLPTTLVLDDFDRPDGELGAPWIIDQPGLAIVDGTLASSAGSVRALWSDEFASAQEVWATIGPEAAVSKRVALVLKATGLDPTATRVEVSYDPTAHSVLVTTDDLSFRKLNRGAPMPVTLVPGDRFGARCTTDGRIEVFVNGSRLGSVSLSGWPAAGAPGQIGVWIEAGPANVPVKEGERPRTLALHYGRNDPRAGIPPLPQVGPPNGVFDDFGGGDTFIPGNRAPVVNVALPADSSFFDATGPITFHGGATDVEDPADSLRLRWRIVLHHTNRTDPALVVFGPGGSFTPVDPGTEAGTWYEIVLAATDTEGATDSTTTRIFPESDLTLAGLMTNAGHLEPGAAAEMGFWLRNDGPLISTRSFWRALFDGVSVDMEPVTLAGHDSVHVRVALPALAAGPHLIRVVADTLHQCVETDEDDNVLLLAFEISPDNVGVDGDLPRTLALSSPMPNPAAGAVRFALDLPEPALVGLEVHDLQGRTLYRDPAHTLAAGRRVLQWDGRDAGGGRAAPGLYLARIQAGGRAFVRRIALVR